MKTEKYFNLKEASNELARLYGVKYKPATLRRFVAAGEIEGFRLMQTGSSPVMITASSLKTFVQKRRTG